jgi:hypothetical protein
MSRQSGVQVDTGARTVARFGSRALQQPLVEESLDFLIARVRVSPAEILTHQIEPRLEQVECGLERVGW